MDRFNASSSVATRGPQVSHLFFACSQKQRRFKWLSSFSNLENFPTRFWKWVHLLRRSPCEVHKRSRTDQTHQPKITSWKRPASSTQSSSITMDQWTWSLLHQWGKFDCCLPPRHIRPCQRFASDSMLRSCWMSICNVYWSLCWAVPLCVGNYLSMTALLSLKKRGSQ